MATGRTTEQELDLALAAELQGALLSKTCPSDCPHQVAAARNQVCRHRLPAGVPRPFISGLLWPMVAAKPP